MTSYYTTKSYWFGISKRLLTQLCILDKIAYRLANYVQRIRYCLIEWLPRYLSNTLKNLVLILQGIEINISTFSPKAQAELTRAGKILDSLCFAKCHKNAVHFSILTLRSKNSHKIEMIISKRVLYLLKWNFARLFVC